MSSQSSSYIFTPEKFDVPYISLPDRLQQLATEHPEREAMICWSTDGHRKSITYAELYTRSELFAKGLATFGFERNSVIAVTNTNCTEWLVCTLGSQMAGLIPLHISLSNFSTENIVNLLNRIGRCTAIVMEPSNIVVCNEFIENFNKRTESLISTQVPTVRNIFFMNSTDENFMTVQDICNIGSTSVSTLPHISADEICGIFLTSGSTGMAKAVPHTHLKMIHAGFI
ncbi:ACSL [Mytilus edulis]|uniref:ACSL n=1 Tax=Mytilus edulis TaxID=6550 RepID=A0A8S3QUM9_MYTED|nr:ACSL [Mytilus edulis]